MVLAFLNILFCHKEIARNQYKIVAPGKKITFITMPHFYDL